MTWSRRAFLGGAAVTLGLPWLESLVPASRAGATSPVRLLWWFCPCGMHMPAWTPSTEGRSFELPPILAPLAPFRDRLLVLSGLHTPADGENRSPHANGTTGFLTSRIPSYGAVAAGPSVDQIAAARLGADTLFPSLQLGAEGVRSGSLCDPGYACIYTQTISWADARTPLPEAVDPVALFDRLFGGYDPSATAAERARRRAVRTSILDLVLEDAASLEVRLSADDRRRLDRYLTSVREVEQRLVQLADGPGCDVAADDLAAFGDPTATIDRFSELIALAFACDRTRVVSFALGNGGSNRTFDFLGVEGDHHALSHHGGDPRKHAALVAIDSWEMERFAHLLGALDALDDVDGTLLDRSFCVLGSEMGDGDAHDLSNLPVLVAGGGGGAVSGGRHLRLDGRPLLDVHLTALAAAGVDVQPWGDAAGPVDAIGG